MLGQSTQASYTLFHTCSSEQNCYNKLFTQEGSRLLLLFYSDFISFQIWVKSFFTLSIIWNGLYDEILLANS